MVIADRGFPFWPQIETVDLALVDDVPTVSQTLAPIRSDFISGKAWMAQEFLQGNPKNTRTRFMAAVKGVEVAFETKIECKERLPQAIGSIHAGDTAQYANLILELA